MEFGSQGLGLGASGAIAAHHQSGAEAAGLNPGQDLNAIHNSLDRSECRYVDDDALAMRRYPAPERGIRPAPVELRIDEIVNDLNRIGHGKGVDRCLTQIV